MRLNLIDVSIYLKSDKKGFRMDIIQIAETYSQNNKKLTETIIKEFLHYEILKILHKSSKTKESLVFQGGTALRLCYNGTRFSEDLDFCIANNKEFVLILWKIQQGFYRHNLSKIWLTSRSKKFKSK